MEFKLRSEGGTQVVRCAVEVWVRSPGRAGGTCVDCLRSGRGSSREPRAPEWLEMESEEDLE